MVAKNDKECINFSIDVDLVKSTIKFVDVHGQSKSGYTFSVAEADNMTKKVWEGDPQSEHVVVLEKDKYYVVSAQPGPGMEFQKIAQIILKHNTFRVKEVDTPPNTLFMTVQQRDKAKKSMVEKINEIADKCDSVDNKQVLVFAEDAFYRNLSPEDQNRCVWKEYTFEMDVERCTVTHKPNKGSNVELLIYAGEGSCKGTPVFQHSGSKQNRNPQAMTRNQPYTLYVRRRPDEDPVPVVVFTITDATAIIRELSNQKQISESNTFGPMFMRSTKRQKNQSKSRRNSQRYEVPQLQT